MNVTNCSVTVMRSHDYCHFSVTLGATFQGPDYQSATDALRKEAARLADKAVHQYKQSKRAQELRGSYDWRVMSDAAATARMTPETERTPEQTAAIKAWSDRQFESKFDYQDDWRHPDDDEEDGQ